MRLKEIVDSMTQDERNKFKERFEHPDPVSVGMEVIIFFPDGFGLEPFTYFGAVPHVGERFYIRTMSLLPPENKYDYDQRKWKVENVSWSCMVPSNDKDKLLIDPNVHVEVILEAIKD